jgi:hypothetical protein
MEKLQTFCLAQSKRGCNWEFIEASLRHPDAKVWIHQGRWLRWKKRADRNLSVDTWLANAKTMPLRDKRIPIWAQLTPNGECQLDLKGGFVDEKLESIGKPPKPHRSKELSDFGYT